MVSEFMLQQTPGRAGAARARGLARPLADPAALAAEPTGEAVRVWGRLGYPRRALRLHAAATAIVERARRRGARRRTTSCCALPGVGDYTAAAIAAFAYGQRHVVLDTNVRRVLARAVAGVEFPAALGHQGRARRSPRRCCPTTTPTAATWSVAVMELGALVCTADRPALRRCPVADRCAWRAAGHPAYDGPPRKVQTYAGTDRQCRGRLLAVLRDSRRRGARRAGSTRPGTTPTSASGAWPPCSTTGWSSRPAPARYALP